MNEDQSDEISDRDLMGGAGLFEAADEAIKAWDEVTDTTRPGAFLRMKQAMEKLRNAAEEHQADEVGRVVDAMTPEQVDAYLVSMGVNLDEMRAHTEEMRKKLEARFSSSPNVGDQPRAGDAPTPKQKDPL